MKLIAPNYYKSFQCIASKCGHTCCRGWEIDIDEESLRRFEKMPDIVPFIDYEETPHFRLLEGEQCPFLNEDGLCRQILEHGEETLCQICTDHPRFRNYWSDRVELGIGLVCEEAARLILASPEPMKLVVLEDDGGKERLGRQEKKLLKRRTDLMRNIPFNGPEARLLEYLIYRHIPDAVFDGRYEQRLAFISSSFNEITAAWHKTDGSIEALVECARCFSYDVEYDDEVLEKRISGQDSNMQQQYDAPKTAHLV